MWDERDIELNIRNRLASLIAETQSGVPGAEPTLEDYASADLLKRTLDEEL